MAPLAKKLNEKLDEKFSYADYLSWPDDERWEIIKGVAYDMSLAPVREHQRMSAIIFAKIYNFLSSKECEVYFAPSIKIRPRNCCFMKSMASKNIGLLILMQSMS